MNQLKAVRYFILAVSLFLLPHNPLRADIVIPNGITGAWFNPDLDGQGFFIEVANVEGNRVFVVTWYTYEQGKQMWLLGSTPLSPEDRWVRVPMQVRHGAEFGEAFDPNAVVSAEWGTLEFNFESCHSGTVFYQGLSGEGSMDLIRLTLINGLGCEAEETPGNGSPPLPPPPTQ